MAPISKLSFQNVPKSNQELAAEIEALVKQQHDSSTSEPEKGAEDDAAMKEILKTLYSRICEFCTYRGQPATPDKTMIAAWASFLEPIRRLADFKPHGDLLAARMVLYLARGFQTQYQLATQFPAEAASSVTRINLRCDFLIALDNTLLDSLVKLWERSNKREEFHWVLTEHPVSNRGDYCGNVTHEKRNPYQTDEEEEEARLRTACLTKPSDMTEANGVQGRREWRRQDGDTAHHPHHPLADSWSYGPGDQDEDRLLMWERFGNDGPIRDRYTYDIVDESNRFHSRSRPLLRRSLQLVLDARRIAPIYLDQDRRWLTDMGLERRLPAELRLQVLSYLDVPEEHPYLSRLDLSAAFRPWPEVAKACDICKQGGNASKTVKATCPAKAITIWNLPLRAFMTWHTGHRGEWHLCRHIGCDGHHDSAEWMIQTHDELVTFLNGIVQRRCGPGADLQSVGLGPCEPIMAESWEADQERLKVMFRYKRDANDAHREAEWTGLGGLVDAMVHGRTLLGFSTYGKTTTGINWGVGRTKADESRVLGTLHLSHVHCALC